jgi:hypothetical protein
VAGFGCNLADSARFQTEPRRHVLIVYQPCYAEPSQRQGLLLAAPDTELAEAARRERVSLVGETE